MRERNDDCTYLVVCKRNRSHRMQMENVEKRTPTHRRASSPLRPVSPEELARRISRGEDIESPLDIHVLLLRYDTS